VGHEAVLLQLGWERSAGRRDDERHAVQRRIPDLVSDGSSGSIVSTTPRSFRRTGPAESGQRSRASSRRSASSPTANTVSGIGGALSLASLPQTVTSSKITLTYQFPAGTTAGNFGVTFIADLTPTQYEF